MSSKAQQPHAVLIPQPAQGHVTPMLHLAKVLHGRGFFVTFVNSEYNHRRLLRSRDPGSLDGTDGFRFEAVPDGLPQSNDDDVTQDIAALCLSTTKHSAAPFRELLARLNESTAATPPVSCVIADGVMSFAQRVAEDMGIPALVFWTTSACGFMGYLHFAELVRRGYVPLKDESDLTNGYLDTAIDWIPGMDGVRLKDIPSFIRTTDPDDVMLNFDGGEAQNARGARGLILNTYDALEQDVLDALRLEFPRLYTVGPLPAFTRGAELDAIGGNLWKEDASCLRWLDAQEQPGSVVYVNFGSITVVTPAQLAEFAWGLASCGRPFLWVVRPDLVSGEQAVLPEEFVRETKDRGILASWCPQELVLQHPSVGLFLTHCGWNSTLESVCAGVPMVCWPFFAEQPTNCRYACAKWGIGMEIGSEVARKEVARLVQEAMDGERGKEMRVSALAWRDRARAATAEDGSSSENLDRLIEFLRAGCV